MTQDSFKKAILLTSSTPRLVLALITLAFIARTPVFNQGFYAADSALMLPVFLLTETSLSFLGVGVQEPEASLGSLLAEAANINLLQSSAALVILAPAFAITFFVLGTRLIGNGLEKFSQTVEAGNGLTEG